MKVAVYSISKNEEQFVTRWSESAKDADLILNAANHNSPLSLIKRNHNK